MAHSVKSLAQRWDCSRKKIYNMIDAGQLETFSLGPRGIRISDEEVSKWESNQKTATGTGTLPSDNQADTGLPTSIM